MTGFTVGVFAHTISSLFSTCSINMINYRIIDIIDYNVYRLYTWSLISSVPSLTMLPHVHVAGMG